MPAADHKSLVLAGFRPWLRRGLLTTGGLILAWVTATAGFCLYLKYQRGFTEARYRNLVLPHRWPLHKVAWGDHYIQQAEQHVAKREYNQAVRLASSGLAKSPANLRGRLLLAELMLAARQPGQARQILADGLTHGSGDLDYLRATFGLLLEQQQDERLLQLAASLLAGGQLPPAAATLIALFAARAEYHLGRSARAEDMIRRHKLSAHSEAVALQARIDWDHGYRELAVLRLQEHCRQSVDDHPAQAQLAVFLRELGRWDDLQTLSVQRLAVAPLAFAPRIELLRLHHYRSDFARVERDAAACLANFSRDPAALLMLADFAASTGRPVLARQTLDLATRLRLPDGSFRLMLAEAHLTARDYGTALDHLIELTRADAPAAGPQSVLSGLQAIASYGLNRPDDARRHLTVLLAQSHPRSDNLLAIARRLQAAGQPGPAREVLARIAAVDPPHQPALDALVRLDLETGDIEALPGHLERLLKTRRPPPDTLRLAAAELGSDKHLLRPGQASLLATLQAALAGHSPGP